MKRLLLTALVVLPSFAFANGHVIPNGGDVAVCPADKAKPDIFHQGLAFLDLFEIKSSYRYTYRELATFRSMDLETAFPLAVKKFFDRSRSAQEMLLAHFGERAAQIRFVNGLKRLPEGSLNAVLQGCRVRSFATQYSRTNSVPGTPLAIEIDRAIWQAAGTDQKLALLFHEYIFGEQLNSGTPCAHAYVSRLVGSVLSDQAATWSLNQWVFLWNPSCTPDEKSGG